MSAKFVSNVIPTGPDGYNTLFYTMAFCGIAIATSNNFESACTSRRGRDLSKTNNDIYS